MLFAITYKTNNALGFDIDFRLYCGFVEFISFFFVFNHSARSVGSDDLNHEKRKFLFAH